MVIHPEYNNTCKIADETVKDEYNPIRESIF
jgi:hypothetical protein